MKIELSIKFFVENSSIIALCPDLNVSSFGNTIEEAEHSLKEALDLFFEGCESQNSIPDVLEESGFHLVNGSWINRKPIKTTKTIFQHTSGTVSYA